MTTKAPKRLTEYYRATDEMEGALMGCDQIRWEYVESLYASMSPTALITLKVTPSQLMRIKRALDKLNEIVNR